MSKLTGEAQQSVSGIYLSNENYSCVVDLLKERYGDAQTVINTHCVEHKFEACTKYSEGTT